MKFEIQTERDKPTEVWVENTHDSTATLGIWNGPYQDASATLEPGEARRVAAALIRAADEAETNRPTT